MICWLPKLLTSGSSPGHATGHVCGLARTAPDEFLLMGGDVAHHGGEFRPTQWLPLPDSIQIPSARGGAPPAVCPGEAFERLHPRHSATEPFMDPVGPMHDDAGQVIGTIIEVPNYGGGDLLNIRQVEGRATALLPFTKAFVPQVDIAGRRVVAQAPADLFAPARETDPEASR